MLSSEVRITKSQACMIVTKAARVYEHHDDQDTEKAPIQAPSHQIAILHVGLDVVGALQRGAVDCEGRIGREAGVDAERDRNRQAVLDAACITKPALAVTQQDRKQCQRHRD